MTTAAPASAPYYAQAFSPLPGRCFRLVTRGGEGGPTHWCGCLLASVSPTPAKEGAQKCAIRGVLARRFILRPHT
jgi:hypothetical protein